MSNEGDHRWDLHEGDKGYLPECDVEVTPKTDRNFWPVREYVVWFANRC